MRELEQERIDLLVRATRAGLLDWDAAADTTTYSARFKEMLGYPAEADTAGWPPFFDFVHPEDRERIRASFQAQLRDRSVKNGVVTSDDPDDYRLRRADGSWLWIHAEAIRLTDAEGRTLRYICSFIDISERKRQELEHAGMEQRLREQIALTEAIVAQAPNSIFAKDREGRFTLVNRGWSEMSGRSAAEALGKSVRDLYPAAAAQRFAEEDEKLLARGPDAPPMETVHTGPRPGQYRIVRKAVLSRDGEVLGLVCSSTDISELKRMERDLAEERQRLALVVRATQAGIVDWDTATETPWYSERFKEMLGYAADADTSAWSSFLGALAHPEDRDRSREVFFTGLVKKGEPDGVTVQEPIELRLRRADGGWLWVQCHGLTLHDAEGEAKRYLAAVTDISERRAQEEALRNQFKYINELLDSMPVAVAMRDTESRYLLVNRRWEEYFEVPRDQIVGRSLRERASERMTEKVLALDRAVLERGPGALLQEDDFEYRGRKFSQTRSVMTDAQGRVLGVLIASIDTSERNAMEQDLAHERERLALLVRSTKAGFMDWDAIADTRAYSPRFKEMLGYAADADTSQWPSLFEMVHPQDREATRDAFRDMLRSGAATGERMHGPLECRLRKADGSYLWVRGEGISQMDAEGRTTRFLASYIDITQLREMNLALEESVRLREEVDRISRHDLKTPLNSIIMIPRLLRDSGRLQAEDAELLAFVEQSGYRLLSMVNLSLDMFRMEQGSYPFSPKAVDLRATLQNVARDVAASAQSYGVTLAIEGDPRHALGEELLCYSLLANLVKNAIEASPAGGKVTLRLCGTKEEAWVEVHNPGTVPEEIRARFFDKYSTSGKRSGTGLGTYSARLMARTQRGDLTMYTSEADGTTLRLRLKAAQAPAPRNQAIGASEAGQAAPPASLSVLVVDDDEYTRVFVQRFMPPSMRTATAADGRQALEMFRREPRDVVVMDLDMPVMGGLEAAQAMRRHERENAGQGRAILLAMSSHDDPATAERALAAGFDRYLSKPVSPDAIRRAINDLTQTDQVLLDPDLKGALPGFLESRRELIDQLAGALERGDAEPARALAHKLAGSFALYGFRWAAAQGKMIEQRAREQRLDGLAAEVAALRRHLDTVDVTVKAEVRP